MSLEAVNLDKGIFTVDGIFSPAECLALIERGEALGFQEATVSLSSGARMLKDLRNNDRVNFDDEMLAASLYAKVVDLVPSVINDWTAIGLNPHFRFYRYDPGQQFKRHRDGIERFDSGDESRLTFLIYLNEGYVGGETIFSDYVAGADDSSAEKQKIVVQPRTGMGLFFIHRRFHEGAAVTEGRKYVLRSDVVYRRNAAVNP